MREPPLAPPSFKVSQAAGPATMITILYAGVAVIDAAATIYFAWRSREFRKFLAGAFFVSGGIQFYLYLGDVSVPLLGTNFVLTPELSGVRSIIHLVLFLICWYFGFIRRPKGSTSRARERCD
jgi:uncharacterized protein (DUF486 family)